MKYEACRKGTMICGKHNVPIYGEIVDTASRGTVIIKSYYDDCNHYINAKRLKPINLQYESNNGNTICKFDRLNVVAIGCDDRVNEIILYERMREAIKQAVKLLRKEGKITSWNGCTISLAKMNKPKEKRMRPSAG